VFFGKKNSIIATAAGDPPPNPRFPPAARLPRCFSRLLL